MADALVVAGVAGGEAWARAQREYFQRCPRPYMRLVAAIQDNDFLGAPARAPLPPCFRRRAVGSPSPVGMAPGAPLEQRQGRPGGLARGPMRGQTRGPPARPSSLARAGLRGCR
jgi:hypothetical protein